LARICLEQTNPSAAADELRLAIAAKPSAELHFELGLAQGQLGDLSAAAAEFRAIKLNPRYATAYDRLGVTLRRQDDHIGAVAAFRRAVELRPGFEQARYNLGIALR
jgi:Flp pilus assembly protein TadD